MKEMSPTKALVVQYSLAAQRGRERDWIRAAGLPRSTYQQARKQVYEDGWIEDRFVPNPSALAISSVTFAVMKPYTERLADISRAWEDLPTSVCLWTGRESVMGVFFGSPSDEELRLHSALKSSPSSAGTWVVSVDPQAASVPAYFDFEGVWASFCGLGGTLTYPQPLLGKRLIGRKQGAGPLTVRAKGRLGGLVARPFVKGGSGFRTHPYFLPRSERRMISEGWVSHRSFIDLRNLPPCGGRRLEGVAWLHGTLIPGQRAPDVFRALVERCHVKPFLFASNADQALLGTLSQKPPPDSTIFPSRAPVLETLEAYLSNIETIREPIESVIVGVNHRYERLFSSTT